MATLSARARASHPTLQKYKGHSLAKAVAHQLLAGRLATVPRSTRVPGRQKSLCHTGQRTELKQKYILWNTGQLILFGGQIESEADDS
jgi:hypothetical protein